MSKNYPERRSIRLRGYDYSQDGLYFITICTYNREPIFGRIANGKMQLNDAGIIARDAWLDTARIRPNVVLGDFVVMPNHFHAVFAIDNTVSHCRGVLHTPVTTTTNIPSSRKGVLHTPDKIFNISLDDDNAGIPNTGLDNAGVCNTGLDNTGVCNTGLDNNGVCNTPLQSPSQTVGAIIRGFKSVVSKRIGYSVWQRNYYEHIIRNEHSLHRISQYIVSNPDRWQDDCFFDK